MCEQEASKSRKLLWCRNSSWPNRREWIRGQWQWRVSRFLPWLQSCWQIPSERYWTALTLLMGAVRLTCRKSCHRKLPDMKVLDSVFVNSNPQTRICTSCAGCQPCCHLISWVLQEFWRSIRYAISAASSCSWALLFPDLLFLHPSWGSTLEMKATDTLLFSIWILSFWIIFLPFGGRASSFLHRLDAELELRVVQCPTSPTL